MPTKKPVVLPYIDVLRGRYGHQFGLRNGKGGIDILVLFENGDTERTSSPILIPSNPKEGKPAQPHQYWAFTRLPEDTGHLSIHRVHAPRKGPCSWPITKRTLKPRYTFSVSKTAESGTPHFVKRPIICTPSGRGYFRARIGELALRGFSFDLCAADYACDVPVPKSFIRFMRSSGLSGEVLKVDVSLGVTAFACAWIHDRVLLGIQPERFALEQRLWTSHLLAGVLSQIGERATEILAS